MDCSTPGSSVLHYFLEVAQIHVHSLVSTVLWTLLCSHLMCGEEKNISLLHVYCVERKDYQQLTHIPRHTQVSLNSGLGKP